jgi:ATP-dependent Clp protease ATP-binding subunit ClpB
VPVRFGIFDCPHCCPDLIFQSLIIDPNLEDHYYPRSHEEANTRQSDFSPELLPYRDYRKFTALHYACIIQNPEMVALLLDHMADPTARTAHGLTPREYLYYVERFTGEKNLKIETALRG